MAIYGVRIRCLTPSLKKENKLLFGWDRFDCYFNNGRNEYKNEKTFYLASGNNWIPSYTTDTNKIKQFLTPNNAIKKAESKQRFINQIIKKFNLNCQFVADVVELKFTVRTYTLKEQNKKK